MTEYQHVEYEYRVIFRGTGDGILVVDRQDGSILDANPAACHMVGLTHEEMVGIDPISFVHPISRPIYESHVRGREIDYLDERVSLLAMHRDGTTFDVEVQVRTVDLRGKLVRVAVVRDVTERVRAVELLEQGVRARTAELSALLDLSQAINETLELEPLLGRVLDLLGLIVESNEAAILLLDGDELCVSAYRGSVDPEKLLGRRARAADAVVFKAVAVSDGPIIIDNLEGDDPLAVAYRVWAGGVSMEPWVVPHSVLAVPLKVKGTLIGHLRLDHKETSFYRPRHAELALAFANQAATAIANARLFVAERRSRENLELALEAGQMGTWDWDTATGRVVWSAEFEAIRGLAPGEFPQTFEATFRDIHPDDVARVRQAITRSLEQGMHHIEYRIIRPDGRLRWLESRGQVVRDPEGRPRGLRGVCMDVTDRKDAEAEHDRLVAREQAAIEARAVLEERQKLARELHDSVSQSLYGLGTAAQTARSALSDDHDPAAAAQALEYVVAMADVGLAEMRALIAELRPETLAQEGLVAALERHVESVRAGHRMTIVTQLGSEPDLPLSAKETLYRIGREALHNAVKHAHARSVRIALERVADDVVLEVIDDGVGFDPSAAHAGHFGLASMGERARAAGGQLSIDSQPRHGTRVTARVPASPA